MSGKRPYVPVLRAKRGEFGALRDLGSAEKEVTIPLFELTPPPFQKAANKPKPLPDHLKNQAELIADATEDFTETWVYDRCVRPATVDGTTLHPIEFFFDALGAAGDRIVPVVSTRSDPTYRAAATRQAAKAQRMVLRVTLRDVFDPAAAKRLVDTMLAAASLSPDKADLVLDIAPFTPEQADTALISAAAILPSIPYVNAWNTFTVITTSMPVKPYEVIPNNSITHLPRACWALWQQLQAVKAPRLPGFGDYAIDNPNTDLDQEFYSSPIPMIRYALKDSWMFLRGTSRPKGAPKREVDWPELSRKLIASGCYMGEHYSAGDAFIKRCADGAPKHSGGSAWRNAGVNHHITLVVEQLASYP